MLKRLLFASVFVSLVAAYGIAAGETPNLALRRPYTLVPDTNYSYCTEEGDATQLTDGELVSDKQFWIQPGCVGWKLPLDGEAEAIIDLGAVHAIDTIRFRTSSGPNADVYLPSATFAVSDDGRDFRVVGRVDTRRDRQVWRRWVVAKGLRTRGRFVLVRLHAHGVFAFWDEIEVYGGTHDPATAALPEERIEPLKVEIPETPLQRRLRRDLAGMRARLAELSGKQQGAFEARLAALQVEIEGLSDAIGDAARAAENKVIAIHHDLLAALHTDADMRLWPAAPYGALSPLDIPPKNGEDKINVLMGQNAHAAAAVNVTNLSDAAVEVTVALEGLNGIARLREARFIPTRQGNLLADALPLLDDGTLTLPPWETRQVWLSLASGEQKPGKYAGALVCERARPSRLPLTVEIVSVRIPDDLPVSTYSWQYVDVWPTLKGIEKEAVADLVAHHTNVCLLTAGSAAWPEKVDGEGNLTAPLDFTKHDRMVELCRPMSSHGVSWFVAFEFGKRGFDRFKRMDEKWQRLFRQWLKAWIAHLKELGVGYDRFLFYPLDETIDETFVALARLARETDPKIRIFADPMGWDSDERLRMALPLVDVWCPSLSGYRKRPWQLQMIKDTGATVWSYMVGRRETPPYAGYRLHLWRAWQNGVTGAGFWAYAQGGSWTDDDLWDDFGDKSSDYGVIYTLKGAPKDVSRAEVIIPGKRWEAWRDGIEDYVYLYLFNEALAARPESAAERAWLTKTVAEVLASADDPTRAAQARAKILRRLAATSGK